MPPDAFDSAVSVAKLTGQEGSEKRTEVVHCHYAALERGFRDVAILVGKPHTLLARQISQQILSMWEAYPLGATYSKFGGILNSTGHALSVISRTIHGESFKNRPVNRSKFPMEFDRENSFV